MTGVEEDIGYTTENQKQFSPNQIIKKKKTHKKNLKTN